MYSLFLDNRKTAWTLIPSSKVLALGRIYVHKMALPFQHVREPTGHSTAERRGVRGSHSSQVLMFSNSKKKDICTGMVHAPFRTSHHLAPMTPVSHTITLRPRRQSTIPLQASHTRTSARSDMHGFRLAGPGLMGQLAGPGAAARAHDVQGC